MKLRKAKRFNTVESYAACICLDSTCSCSCSCNSNTSEFSTPSGRNADRTFNNSHYDSNNSSIRG